MHKNSKRASAVATDTDSLSSSAERRDPFDELGLTDTPLPGGAALLDPLLPQLEHPSEPSEPASENVRDSAISEGTEGSEATEGHLLDPPTRAHARDDGGGGIGTPLDPFDPFITPAPQGRLPVELEGGYAPHDLAVQLWEHVVKTNTQAPRLYISGGAPIRLEMIDGAIQPITLTRYRLASEVHRVATFTTVKNDEPYEVPAPADLIHEMLSVPVLDIPLPRLCRLDAAPFIDEEGVVVSRPGYYPRIQAFLDFRQPLPAIPLSPTPDDVERARDLIRQPLADFPFVSDASYTVAIAAMLLPFLRRHIDGPTPLHLIDKATPGTGATLLTDALLAPALGSHIPKMSAPASDIEWFYSLPAVLRALPQAVVIDNARELMSKELAKALTDRIMLVSRVVRTSASATVPIECVWIANGNNVVLHQEIARRVVRCRLDAGMERPWQGRRFRIPHLPQWLREHRTDLIWACLTIIRSWFAAGRPAGTRVLGMYESYSAVVGGVLDHIGLPGFLTDDTLPDAVADLQSEAESGFVSAWWDAYGRRPVTLQDLLMIANTTGCIVLEYWGYVPAAGLLSKLGHFLRSMRDKTFNVPQTDKHPPSVVVVHRLSNDPATRRARYDLLVRGAQ